MHNPNKALDESNVCTKCVADPILIDLVKNNCNSKSCSFCHEEECIAAPSKIITDYIYEVIFKYYGKAEDLGISYDRGWVLPQIPIEDILFEFNPGWSDDFNEHLVGLADIEWYLVRQTNNDWMEPPLNKILSYGWSGFKEQILYRTRYFFLEEPKDDSIDPHEVSIPSLLSLLAKMCLEFNLITTIPKGTSFYRVRSCAVDDVFDKFENLSVPPKGIATAGRMNPAGIAYFYLASTLTTAISEVITDQKTWYAGNFILSEDVSIIDFSNLPEIPSIFDLKKYIHKEKLIFLHDFVDDIGKSVEKDGREHVDYVPTQVVSEFFRYKFEPKVMGIKYSSIKEKDGVNIAFFESDNRRLKSLFELIYIEKQQAP